MAKKWHQLEKLDHTALKKLQIEREKAAKAQQEAADRKQKMIIGASILIFLIFVAVFVSIMRSRRAELERQDLRTQMLVSKVTDFSGSIEHRELGTWSKLRENFEFDREYSFRGIEESIVTINLQLENQIKMIGRSEITIGIPELAPIENKILSQTVELKRGEVTVAISLDGRGIIKLQVADILISGSSGLFKVIYDERRGRGEVVVKNGLVEVSKKGSSAQPIRVSGFYKVGFGGGDLGSPTQASVIQYDWR